ncbi:MAG: hypothetical protein GXP10_06100 [Gammaproteobacteria bacterium]|nr:hypothetical protein [Gammaproteobacteria bacterium]
MLQFIRSHAQGFIAWVIVGFIILVFGMWGIQNYVTSEGNVAVAVVDGEEVSQQEFLQLYRGFYQQRREQIQSILGANFDPAILDENRLRKDVLKQILDEKVLKKQAEREGFRIGDAQLGSEIRAIGAFQKDGQFDKALYERLLRNQGQEPVGFEVKMRQDLLATQLTTGLLASSFVTSSELDLVARLQNEQRKVSYLVLQPGDSTESIEIDAAAIDEYYQANQKLYEIPEKVSVAYVELSVPDLVAQVDVDESELRAMYEARTADYQTDEQRRASHILILVDDDSEEEAAQSKAAEVLDKVRAGEDFAALAKLYSDDPGSAGKGGDIGFFRKGDMDLAFEEAAYSMAKGEVSELVKSRYGYHIIRLTDIRGGSIKPFDEVRPELEREVRLRVAQEQFYDLSETLTNIAYEHPDSLQVAAEELALPIKASGYFSINSGTGIAENPVIRRAAFSDDVYLHNNNSELIEVAADRVLVLHVKDKKPSSVRPLEDVKADIVAQLQTAKARAQLESLGESLVEKIRAGDAAADIASEHGTEWKDAGFVGRSGGAGIDRAIVNAVFELQKPHATNGEQEVKPTVSGVALPNGGYAVFSVTAYREGALSEDDGASRESMVVAQARRMGGAEMEAFIELLLKQADVQTFSENM